MKLEKGKVLDEIVISQEELENGILLIDILVFAGMATSKREARQFIKDGAVRLTKLPHNPNELK